MTESEPQLPLDSAEALRTEIDAIDDQVLTLVQRRLKASESLAAASGEGPLSPAREVELMRRLIAAAQPPVEADFVVELWRVLIGANLRRQGPIDVAVAGGADPVRLFDAARRHFGARTRIQRAADPRAALMKAVESARTVALVPWPSASGAGGWWPTLSESRFHKLALIGALPMRAAGEGDPEAALFASNAPSAAAGGDVTLAMAFDPHHRAIKTLADAGLEAREIARSEPRVLFRIEGFVKPDDVRVSTLARGGLDGFRVLGSFARV
ncbi:MAG: chorismate mutase [Hyphomonadaceae bacterium]